MNPQTQNYNQMDGNPMAYIQMHNPSNNIATMGGGTSGMAPYMSTNSGAYNTIQSAQILKPTQPSKSKFSFF